MHNFTYCKLEDIINYDTLANSFVACTKGLTWKGSINRFDLFYDMYSSDIMNQFYIDGVYQRDPLFHTFIHERGKERLICSTTVRDRVVDKCFNQIFLLPAFAPRFIYDNGASLPGKGVDFCLDRFEDMMRRAHIEYGGSNFYFLKCDIKQFFDSIPHEYILDQIARATIDPRIMQFYIGHFTELFFDPYVHGGEQVPFGVGLGSEQNQTFGLLCLNEMDHMIKEKYHIKYYVRYMDDFILIHKDKDYLKHVKEELEQYLHNILNLHFNENKTNLIPGKDGVVFLKIHFKFDNRYAVHRAVCKQTLRRLRRKMKKMSDLYKEELISWKDIENFYASSRGTILRTDSTKQLEAMDNLFENLFFYNVISREEFEYYEINKSYDEMIEDLNELVRTQGILVDDI